MPTALLPPRFPTSQLVPPTGAERFVQAARAAGVDAQQVDVPFADHAFDVGPAGSLGRQAAWSVLQRWAGDRVGPASG